MTERDREISSDRPDRDPDQPTRAANQLFAAEEVPPTRRAADHPPSTGTGRPDARADRPHPAAAADPADPAAATGADSGVGAPQRTTPDVPAAPGTSETSPPVDGVHTPDAGPGGSDFDTDDRPVPGRTAQSRL